MLLLTAFVSVVLVRMNHERKQLSSFTFGIQNPAGKDDMSNTTSKVTFIVRVGGELGNHVSSTHEALSAHVLP
jgi:hypothetical protein